MQRRANQRGAKDDHRKRQLHERDRDKRSHRDQDGKPVLQRTFRDLHQRLEHDCEHCGSQTEQQAVDQRYVAEQKVEYRKAGYDGCARQHEQQPGHEPAPDTMQQPAGIGRQLHSLGSGQQHAVVERMQEPWLVEPALLVDEDLVHQRDLACRSAKGKQADPGEGSGRFGERRVRCGGRKRVHASLPSPASCAFRGGRDGTSHRARRRSACPFRVGPGHRARWRKGRARSPASPAAWGSSSGRAVSAPRTMRARWSRAGSARPNSEISVSKVQVSPRCE